MCHVPPSVEFLGRNTPPSFQRKDTRHPQFSNQDSRQAVFKPRPMTPDMSRGFKPGPTAP